MKTKTETPKYPVNQKVPLTYKERLNGLSIDEFIVLEYLLGFKEKSNVKVTPQIIERLKSMRLIVPPDNPRGWDRKGDFTYDDYFHLTELKHEKQERLVSRKIKRERLEAK